MNPELKPLTLTISSYGNHYKKLRASLRHSQNAVEEKILQYKHDHISNDTEEDSHEYESYMELFSTRDFYRKLLADLEAQYKIAQPHLVEEY